MNRTKLKNYAPQARRDFIQAMIDRSAFYGLTAKKTEPIEVRGDSAVIAGRLFPKSVAEKRQKLERRIKRHGFDQTMEALAYTWFNRLVAIRFMELHGYLDHGYRVLSHPEGKSTPEILEHAEHVELAGLKKEAVIDLKLAGNKESELYRTLLIAQCNALHSAMPFLFEKIEDETELLLPENLLHSDSLIRKLVEEIEEEDWQEVEIIGWLYQFYISEKKDQVIGKVVASEDIPAATQLFTPNWIVKYLVQNTLGRQWLATYPESPLRQQMEYYIEPAEQTPEVQEQLKAITPTSLNPEEITLLDPACGSGHILVEAYDLFKAIYLERGYRAKDIPALILQKNLFGLEIDDRAAQLAAFALMMKARADDRRIFEIEAKPCIVAFQDSKGMNATTITHALNSLIPSIGEGKVSELDIDLLLEIFEDAKIFGSLIQIPSELKARLPEIERRLDDVLKFGDLTHASAHVLQPLLYQTRLLARLYDAVVANPPYMGTKGLNTHLKRFAKDNYESVKADLFSMFIIRCHALCELNRSFGLLTPYVWMFIATYLELRQFILGNSSISTLVRLEYNSFEPACVPVCAFSATKHVDPSYLATFVDLAQFKGVDLQSPSLLEAVKNERCKWRYYKQSGDFAAIPGSPIAFWMSAPFIKAFHLFPFADTLVDFRSGIMTGNDSEFLRFWHEVSCSKIAFSSDDYESSCLKYKWFPLGKGGDFRKWSGNVEHVVNLGNGGRAIREGGQNCRLREQRYYLKRHITWSRISNADIAFRMNDVGILFSDAAPGGFNPKISFEYLIAALNSKVCVYLLKIINPTMNYQVSDVGSVPIALEGALVENIINHTKELIELSFADWNLAETAWDFKRCGLIQSLSQQKTFVSFEEWRRSRDSVTRLVKEMEEENNRLFIKAYGLQDELSAEVPDDQITLYRPNREEDIKRLLSYGIGCIMGRYSLDEPGLIYAHSGNEGFDPSKYTTFRADDDGIIPLLETDWGIRDDATNRIVEFIGVAWNKEHLEENLTFIAESLIPSKGEQPRDTIRRYLATGFYKHHLSMYKRRPIYWLFSSGKQRAFQCLVYLHRYNEGTLARMRNEYALPLQGLMSSRIEQLDGDLSKATSTSHRKQLLNEQDKLKKQQAELLAFDEKLKHYADQRIVLDLDDGVKVNYAKFGDLLAEVKAVTGGKGED